MEFLDGRSANEAIKKALAETKTVRVAVAYWGKGAIETLGLDGISADCDVEIICDLMSASCNPDVIASLLERFPNRVFMRDGLHAKVWLIDQVVILGSSNASSNGLGFEGAEVTGSLEANARTTHEGFRKAVRDWYSKIRRGAQLVDQPALAEARQLWNKHRKDRPPPRGSRTLLETVQSDPSAFDDRNIFVWIGKLEEPDDDDEAVAEKERTDRNNPNIHFWVFDANEIIDVHGGDFILEWDTRSGRPDFEGLSRIVMDRPIVEKNGFRYLFCIPVTQWNGLQLGDRRTWNAAARRAFQRQNGTDYEEPLSTFARDYLTARNV